ncbi:MAG: terminase family protein [Gammaproteobacteria bacterium]|nr:terminase family protein [Gammaproteobacteria bacterium]
MPNYPPEIIESAKLLYLKKWSPNEIQKQLGLNNARVVYQWAQKGAWTQLLQHETVEQAITRRLIALAEKDNKDEFDLNEMDRLINQLDKFANIELKKARTKKEVARAKSEQDGGGGERSKGNRRSKGNSKRKANDISHITKEQLAEIREELFYSYQHKWHENKFQRTRFILKSRQIGATYYFAWEALEDAILTGENQVFLSASRSQAEIFKAYIIAFGVKYLDAEFKGEVITLSNGAELRFMSTSARSANGYHGHLYIDEVFWIPDFLKLNKVASGIAAHKKWRKTYFSTPSVKSHGAYTLWTGEKYNDKRVRKVEFELSHKKLKDGLLGQDKIWRNVITVKEAQKQGCDLFDIDELIDEYSEAEFNNLFMCAFMEAGLSVFKLDDLFKCAVDSNVTWVDFKRKQLRPYGNLPVWIGYDPARRGDKSTVVVIAPPLKEGGKFRVLEKINLRGSFPFQANRIEELTIKYNVVFIGVDTTGPGLGVFDMVQKFFRRATAIHYSLETKTQLVLKAMDVIESGRIEWDAEHTEIPHAFLQVQQTTTGQDKITYIADRTSETGHADVAFSIMHALSNEALSGKKRKASVGF